MDEDLKRVMETEIKSAKAFLVEHNLSVRGIRHPTEDDIATSKGLIHHVLDIMDCSYRELAIKFGWNPLSARSAAEKP